MMTVSGQVKQTIASLKGTKATLQAFAAVEANIQSRQTFERNIARLQGVIQDMNKRVSVLEFEEPQYKGF
ncbi:DUF1657 domain-containing protein [Desulfoscipio sp. XC116]|uniref:DUF1657 domain-containing protein n=1 Tax=Desulfoscipio sp. XC116 TaxID=3144975 RepID=UPI00325AC301